MPQLALRACATTMVTWTRPKRMAPWSLPNTIAFKDEKHIENTTRLLQTEHISHLSLRKSANRNQVPRTVSLSTCGNCSTGQGMYDV